MRRAELIAEAIFEAAETGDVRKSRLMDAASCSERTAQRWIKRWQEKNVIKCRTLLKNIRP